MVHFITLKYMAEETAQAVIRHMDHSVCVDFSDSPVRKRLSTLRHTFGLLSLPMLLIKNEYRLRTSLSVLASAMFAKKRGRAWYPYFEIVLTTRCSLRCKYCSNLMQYYERPCDVPLERVLETIDRMMPLCDYVHRLRPIGGEPFLYRGLADVLEHMLQYENIGQIQIPTNGTVPVKDERLLKLLKNERVSLDISDYGYGNAREFARAMEQNGIGFSYYKAKPWVDIGSMETRGRSPDALRKQFKKCPMFCKSILDGKIHACPRSSHGVDLGLVPEVKGDYLDLLDDEHPVTRKQLLDFYYRTEPVQACDYCDYGTGKLKPVPAGAEQLQQPICGGRKIL